MRNGASATLRRHGVWTTERGAFGVGRPRRFWTWDGPGCGRWMVWCGVAGRGGMRGGAFPGDWMALRA